MKGVTAANVDDFLTDVDVFVDGLDFFAFEPRSIVFSACARLKIPATTAAPLGMGAALLTFLPGRMTFEQYFCWSGCSEQEMALRFLVGLSPAMLQRRYLVDQTAVDFTLHKGPSTPMACELCAGLAATEALKILLGRGRLVIAPRGIHFDAYRNRMVRTWRPGGNNHLAQKLTLAMAKRKLRQFVVPAAPRRAR